MKLSSTDPGKEKVLCIRATTPVVVTMPSRSGAEGRGAAVLQMPSPFHHAERKAPAVITMPSRSKAAHPSVVEMPARFPSARMGEPAERIETGAAERRSPKADRPGLSDSLRMALIALFALLGWPRPTHGKDPGAAAARPWKLELLNVISRLQIPVPATGRGLAAQGPALELPRTMAKGADLASAA